MQIEDRAAGEGIGINRFCVGDRNGELCRARSDQLNAVDADVGVLESEVRRIEGIGPDRLRESYRQRCGGRVQGLTGIRRDVDNDRQGLGKRLAALAGCPQDIVAGRVVLGGHPRIENTPLPRGNGKTELRVSAVAAVLIVGHDLSRGVEQFQHGIQQVGRMVRAVTRRDRMQFDLISRSRLQAINVVPENGHGRLGVEARDVQPIGIVSAATHSDVIVTHIIKIIVSQEPGIAAGRYAAEEPAAVVPQLQ